jgi:hypothetical protein
MFGEKDLSFPIPLVPERIRADQASGSLCAPDSHANLDRPPPANRQAARESALQNVVASKTFTMYRVGATAIERWASEHVLPARAFSMKFGVTLTAGLKAKSPILLGAASGCPS